ncbi:MAG: hypothetical protein ORO03_11655, partial [Alphaproteobacteria bacterium]|nr:hypothetical protein [Alphaproteobacteria bacterium]
MKSCNELSLKEIFYAYRKAKYDCFIDRTIGSAYKFVEYEEKLEENLSKLLENLQYNKHAEYITENHCKTLFVTKKLSSDGGSESK